MNGVGELQWLSRVKGEGWFFSEEWLEGWTSISEAIS